MQEPISRTVSPQAGVGGPAAAGSGVPVQFEQPAHCGKHQQDGALGGRRSIGARSVGDRDAQFGGGADVDGVDPGTQFLHQPKPGTAAKVVSGQRPQHATAHRPRAFRGAEW